MQNNRFSVLETLRKHKSFMYNHTSVSSFSVVTVKYGYLLYMDYFSIVSILSDILTKLI